MIRRFTGIAGASTIAAMAIGGALAVIPTTHAHAATAGACVVQGSASISPGLTEPNQVETYNFQGTAAPCVGVGVTAGAFSGGGTCTGGIIPVPVGGGGLITCVSVLGSAPVEASFFVTASPVGSCSGGILVQVGALVVTECSTGVGAAGVIIGVAVFVPNPAVQNPVTSVNFTGVALGASVP
jgi:hypothetical protein